MNALEWPTGRYRAILADPPWPYETWSEKGSGKSAERQYSTQSIDWIASLPVADLADKDCVLFLWVTYPKLNEVFPVIDAWGFTFKTVAFTWVKTVGQRMEPFLGLGYWTRGNAEICLLATKGKPHRKVKDVEQLIMSPLRQHSRKPDIQYDRIERLVEGPYLELFSRYPREGWDRWGNETRPSQKPFRYEEVAA